MAELQVAEVRFVFSDEENRLAALEAYWRGATDQEIADLLGATRKTVRLWRRREGLFPVWSTEWKIQKDQMEREAKNVATMPYSGPWERRGLIPNTNNPPCPVRVGDSYSVRPGGWLFETGDWAGVPKRYAGTVVQIHEDHRWFRVEYAVKHGVLSECFKF